MKQLTWIPTLFRSAMTENTRTALKWLIFHIAFWVFLLGIAPAAFADEAKATAAILKKDGKAHATQFTDAIRVNIRPELRDELAPIVAAIRHAENGRAGREYGILHKKAVGKSYRTQAGWCAATVQKNYDRWTKAGRKGDFITFLGNRYCPVGAGNDPNGLNRHWIGNVKRLTAKFN